MITDDELWARLDDAARSAREDPELLGRVPRHRRRRRRARVAVALTGTVSAVVAVLLAVGLLARPAAQAPPVADSPTPTAAAATTPLPWAVRGKFALTGGPTDDTRARALAAWDGYQGTDGVGGPHHDVSVLYLGIGYGEVAVLQGRNSAGASRLAFLTTAVRGPTRQFVLRDDRPAPDPATTHEVSLFTDDIGSTADRATDQASRPPGEPFVFVLAQPGATVTVVAHGMAIDLATTPGSYAGEGFAVAALPAGSTRDNTTITVQEKDVVLYRGHPDRSNSDGVDAGVPTTSPAAVPSTYQPGSLLVGGRGLYLLAPDGATTPVDLGTSLPPTVGGVVTTTNGTVLVVDAGGSNPTLLVLRSPGLTSQRVERLARFRPSSVVADSADPGAVWASADEADGRRVLVHLHVGPRATRVDTFPLPGQNPDLPAASGDQVLLYADARGAELIDDDTSTGHLTPIPGGGVAAVGGLTADRVLLSGTDGTTLYDVRSGQQTPVSVPGLTSGVMQGSLREGRVVGLGTFSGDVRKLYTVDMTTGQASVLDAPTGVFEPVLWSQGRIVCVGPDGQHLLSVDPVSGQVRQGPELPAGASVLAPARAS